MFLHLSPASLAPAQMCFHLVKRKSQWKPAKFFDRLPCRSSSFECQSYQVLPEKLLPALRFSNHIYVCFTRESNAPRVQARNKTKL